MGMIQLKALMGVMSDSHGSLDSDISFIVLPPLMSINHFPVQGLVVLYYEAVIGSTEQIST